MSCDYIYGIASGIWDDIGQPSGIAISFISGSIVSETYIGRLNNALNTCYSGVSGCIYPPLGYEEAAVLKELYTIGYYDRQISSITNSALTDDWIELKDDRSTIRRQNKNELAKTFISLRQNVRNDLKDMIFAYQQNNSNVGMISMGNNNEINPYAQASWWWGGHAGGNYNR